MDEHVQVNLLPIYSTSSCTKVTTTCIGQYIGQNMSEYELAQ